MTNEDQIVALFARANPVPTLDLLDPVEALDMEHLTPRSERSSVMTEVRTDEKKAEKEEQQRWPRVALGVAMAVIAVVALGFLVNRATGVASPVSVANAFMDARGDWDGERAQTLFASDAVINDGGDIHQADQYPAFYDWLRSTNETVAENDCATIATGSGGMGTLVRCTWTAQNDLSRALGYEAGAGGIEMWVTNGAISVLSTRGDADSKYGEMWAVLVSWVEDTHPEAIDQMFTSAHMPLYDPSSIALWEKYTDEFVAAQGG